MTRPTLSLPARRALFERLVRTEVQRLAEAAGKKGTATRDQRATVQMGGQNAAAAPPR